MIRSLKKTANTLSKKSVFAYMAVLLFGTAICQTARAAGENEKTLFLESYLQLGPLNFRLPQFHNEPDINGKAFSQGFLFDYPFFEKENAFDARPRQGEVFAWQGGSQVWQTRGKDFQAKVPLADSNHRAWVLNAFYLQAPVYAKATLKVAFSPAFKLYMDGVEVLSQDMAQDTNVPQEKKADLKIEPGYHVFMMKALYTGKEKAGHLVLSITSEEDLQMGAQLEENYGLLHYLHAVSVYAPQLSADGKYFKLSSNFALPKEKKYASVHRIYRTADFNGKDLPQADMTFSGVWGLSFAGKANKYAYGKKSGDWQKIYVGNLGEVAKKVYETTEDLQGFSWDPQGKYLVLSIGDKPKESPNGLKQLQNPMDQWSYYRNRSTLSLLDLASGSRIPLTYGYLSTSLMDVSQDGRYLLFATQQASDSMRQYMVQTVYRMDLQNMQTEELYQTRFPGDASFSPDGTRLLVVGSEKMFTDPHTPGVGVPCKDCLITNDYEKDAFLFDIATKKIEPITASFDPSLESGRWDPSGKSIYFEVADHDKESLYVYGLADKKFTLVPTQTDVLNGFDVCQNAVLYTGSSIDKPFRAYLMRGKNHACVANPQGAQLEKVTIGEHHDWTFQNAEGNTIEAVYYLPPHFDKSKKYPCIVYYYSGTTPTPRALSMRYPKSVWASNGYVVLVLQPSGAIGYNREFSAKHVNNWGITVADEIITGVRRFCAEHAFVDSTRLGCIGASYGGFMTQLLVTRTDLFAAAISHAGISSISSYWGEGYWGYLYGSGANAFSFPWNRKDIFVDQSPLFNADKVHTPLLLLHGTSDVNVPIGESYQMYKALRLLGREVEMVTVAGEDHGIVDYAKRIDWEKTILAWFEKHLKKHPQWWENMYPAKKM